MGMCGFVRGLEKGWGCGCGCGGGGGGDDRLGFFRGCFHQIG